MNKPIQITVVDQIQAAEKRHYLALQKYDQALRMGRPPDILDLLKADVCEAFAELKLAHDRFLNCDDLLKSANG